MAQGDPLQRLLALEVLAPSKIAVDYAAALRTLATALEDPEHGPETTAAVSTWLIEALGLRAPSGEWASWNEARWDAAVDLMADPPALAEFFRRTAERVETHVPRKLHLLSLLRAKVVWRARDKMRRHTSQQARRGTLPPGKAPSVDPQSRCLAGLMIGRIAEQLEDAPQVQQALEVMLAGGSISDAARESGLSRQAIYRAMARLRHWAEGRG